MDSKNLLEDVVLSTLAEIEEEVDVDEVLEPPPSFLQKNEIKKDEVLDIKDVLDTPISQEIKEEQQGIEELKEFHKTKLPETEKATIQPKTESSEKNEVVEKLTKPLEIKEKTKPISENEKEFLELLQIKLATLFEGLKSEDIVNLEQKVELTTKYLEYLLIAIEEKVEEKKEK